jgi:endo-1,4-beta-xylanase
MKIFQYAFISKRNPRSVYITAASVLLVFSSSLYSQIQTNVPALKDVYKNDFYIGCLLSYAHVGFATDPVIAGQSAIADANGGYLIKYHMNSMSPGNWMKPVNIVDITGSASAYSAASTQAAKDSINVNPRVTFNGNIIAQLNWAKRQGFTFRGHTLVWHNQTPGTAFFRSGYTSTGTQLTKELMTARMENFIKEVIRLLHEGWPGLLSAYDVVNEAMNDSGNNRTTESEWYTTFGDNSYIMKAFEFARKYTVLYGETQIKLYYNDYNTSTASKADGIVRVCGPIFRAGLLDGLGMQEHDAMQSPSAAQWIATYNKFDTICTEMAVTELDVSTGSGTNTPSASILATQANQYGQLFKCFVERSKKSGRGKIISVSKDGLNDQLTFVTNQSTSLWNAQDQCKPSFYAAANVGINYNRLDSLISFATSLNKNNYSSDAWTNLTTALSSATSIKNQNFSYATSADTTLRNAANSLQYAIGVITNVSTAGENTARLFVLDQNYPNPFNPTTVIRYQLPVNSMVTLTVFDMLGREVATLVNDIKNAGSHETKFDGSKLPSGMYVYTLRAGNYTQTKKLVLLK